MHCQLLTVDQMDADLGSAAQNAIGICAGIHREGWHALCILHQQPGSLFGTPYCLKLLADVIKSQTVLHQNLSSHAALLEMCRIWLWCRFLT